MTISVSGLSQETVVRTDRQAAIMSRDNNQRPQKEAQEEIDPNLDLIGIRSETGYQTGCDSSRLFVAGRTRSYHRSSVITGNPLAFKLEKY